MIFMTFIDAYKEFFVAWNDVKAKVIRPNMECSNGIIHMIDTVLIDDTPPWTVGSDSNALAFNASYLILISLLFSCLTS